MGVLFKPLDPRVIRDTKVGLLTMTWSEHRTLRRWVDGLTAQAIADEFGLSRRTIEVNLWRIRRKCGLFDWHRIIRAMCVLESDDEIAAYLAGLKPRR
jgi:DNA-binding NarL/FixJ family response regulator